MGFSGKSSHRGSSNRCFLLTVLTVLTIPTLLSCIIFLVLIVVITEFGLLVFNLKTGRYRFCRLTAFCMWRC